MTEKKRGRKKERTQISVRLDDARVDLARLTIERRAKEEIRMTDLIEWGLVLALREIGVSDPIYSQARLILCRKSVRFCRRILNFAALMHMPEVRELKPLERQARDFLLKHIDSIEDWPDYHRALEISGDPSHENSA